MKEIKKKTAPQYNTTASRQLYDNAPFDTSLNMCFCRECWPSDERFGGADMPPEEEFMLVRNLLMSEAESRVFCTCNFFIVVVLSSCLLIGVYLTFPFI